MNFIKKNYFKNDLVLYLRTSTQEYCHRFVYFCFFLYSAQSCLLFVIIIDKKPISIIDNSTGEKEEIGCDLVGLHHDYLSLSSVSSLTS